MDDAAVASQLLGRGGSHQSMEHIEEMNAMDIEPEAPHRCPLAEALLYLMGWGKLSLPDISWLARAAMASSPTDAELIKIGELGSCGEYPNNMRRDLFRSVITKQCQMPHPIPVSVQPIDSLQRPIERELHMINPCALLETLWKDHRDHWEELVGPNPRSFWESLREDDPKLATLGDIRTVPNWENITYPFILHGDAGTYTKKPEVRF